MDTMLYISEIYIDEGQLSNVCDLGAYVEEPIYVGQNQPHHVVVRERRLNSGSKVHPKGFRIGTPGLGLNRYADLDYVDLVHEDFKIRQYIKDTFTRLVC